MDRELDATTAQIDADSIGSTVQLTLRLKVTDITEYPGGNGIRFTDVSGDTFKLGVDGGNIEVAPDAKIDLTQSDEEPSLLMEADGRQTLFVPALGADANLVVTAIEAIETDRGLQFMTTDDSFVASYSPPESSGEDQSSESEADIHPTKSGSPRDTHIPQGTTDDDTESKISDKGASVKSKGVTQEEIADARTEQGELLGGITTGPSGHGLTTYRSVQQLDGLPVTIYEVLVAPRSDPEEIGEGRSLTYKATRRIRSWLDHNKESNGESNDESSQPAIAFHEPKLIAVHGELPAAEISFDGIETVSELRHETDHVLNPTKLTDRTTLEALLADRLRSRATSLGFWARGVDEILSSEPINIEAGSGDFRLYDRYNCSIAVAPTGRVYLHVDARTRVLSNYTLDQINQDRIWAGMRVATTYAGDGYRVSHIGPETVTDEVVHGQMSIPDYHRANPDTDVSETDLHEISQVDRPVVWATRQGRSGGKPLPHAQELLALQGHPENLKEFDRSFWDELKNHWYRSPTRRTQDAWQFATTLNHLPNLETPLEFDTQSSLFTGDETFEFTTLYESDAEVLQFADGMKGDHPKRITEHGYNAYDPPNPFRVALVYPNLLSDTNRDAYWSHINSTLGKMGAPVTKTIPISYNPDVHQSEISEEAAGVAGQLRDHGHDEIDAVMTFLPPEDTSQLGPFADSYDDFKRELGTIPLNSQMARVGKDALSDPFVRRNTALGLLAAAGGIPYTVADAMPGDTELFIGLDVAPSFREMDETDAASGVRVGASATAVLSDGTLLGHSATGAQRGERIPPEQLVRITQQAVYASKEFLGRLPYRIGLQRDGFMNDPLDKVTEFLEQRDIAYDIVEVRKQAPARLVDTDGGVGAPWKGTACIRPDANRAYLATYGRDENLSHRGTPRPITVERAAGDTDIETLARQVYLLAQCDIGVANTTVRLPITTRYADMAANAAAEGYLSRTSKLRRGIGFI